jgi:nucleotide-binding universal stress UspA family protein
MIKSILLAVDGSVYTDSQVRHTIEIARAFDARVKVLTVVDIRMLEWAVQMGTDGFVPVTPSAVYRKETRKILDEKAEAVLSKCAEMFNSAGIRYEVEEIEGLPADIICEKARVVDLLVIGSRGEYAKWPGKMVGDTLNTVVRLWTKPIIITQKDYREINKILFAYDGSSRANRALQLGACFAENMKVPLSVVTVMDKEQIRKRHLEEARAYLEAYDISTEIIGLAGHPDKEIIRIVKDDEFGLTIIGAFGHSRIREALLGSTTEHVLRGIKSPLLLAK